MTRASTGLALALLVSLPGCGHRGDPLPPLRRTPPGVAEFRFGQRGGSLEISCRAPRASVDGIAYEKLEVEIRWAEGQVDLGKAGRKRSVRVAPGARITETLPLPQPGTLVRAAARAVVGGEEGPRTLILALVVQPPMEPPRDLTARLAERGVVLDWRGARPEPVPPPDLTPLSPPVPFGARRPEGEATPRDTEAAPAQPPALEAEAPVSRSTAAETPESTAGTEAERGDESSGESGPPRRHGFRPYRRIESAPYGPPLLEEPQERRVFTDAGAPVGATVCYVVRAVASVDPLIESDPSNEACLSVSDISPPAAPAGLAVLPRGGGLEVVWSPSPEGDLSVYRIYRQSGDAAPTRVTEVPAGTSTWLDVGTTPGTLYRYTVSAVDGAGNEGPPSGAAEGRGP